MLLSHLSLCCSLRSFRCYFLTPLPLVSFFNFNEVPLALSVNRVKQAAATHEAQVHFVVDKMHGQKNWSGQVKTAALWLNASFAGAEMTEMILKTWQYFFLFHFHFWLTIMEVWGQQSLLLNPPQKTPTNNNIWKLNGYSPASICQNKNRDVYGIALH